MKKALEHLAFVREKFLEITDRFATFQAQSLNVHVEFPLLQRLALPIVVGTAKFPGIKIHDTCGGPHFLDKKRPAIRMGTALKMKESPIPKNSQESPTEPEGQGGRRNRQGAQDGGPDRADVRDPIRPKWAAGRSRPWPGCPTSSATAASRCSRLSADKDELSKQIGQLKV